MGKNLKARGNVEDWLMAVQDRMQKVLHDALKEACIDYERRPRVEWIVDGGHPGQVSVGRFYVLFLLVFFSFSSHFSFYTCLLLCLFECF
jgi:hypothetical protein